MKKWLAAGLGLATILIWSAVVLVFLLSPSSSYSVNNHSSSAPLSLSMRTVEKGKLAGHFERERSLGTQEVKTVIGDYKLSKAWMEDVSEDGKLSIDTLLDTLNLNQSKASNS